MKTIHVLTGMLTFCTLLLLADAALAGGEVTVRLQSGRSFTGEVSEHSSDARLWLAFKTESTTLLRPIVWDRIESANYNGREITSEQLRRAAAQLAELPSVQPAPEASPSDRSRSENQAEAALEALRPAPRIESVQIDAFAANWDGDVDNDGLVLQVMPVNRLGQTALVHGTLQIELIGVRNRYGRNVPPEDRDRVVERIASWTRQITPESYGRFAATFRLPYQALHPEFNTQVGSYGLVHVRLVVPGEGVFEVSQDNVRTRPLGVVRSILQRDEADRFFHTERTSRGQIE